MKRHSGESTIKSRRRNWRLFFFLFALLIVLPGSAWLYVTRPHLSAAERGRRLAEVSGCFACHGTDGGQGSFNPGRTDVTVPNWKGDLMMYANDADQIRQWIRDGVTEKRGKSQTWQAERDKGVMKMPAFGGKLSGKQIDDLTAFVMVINGLVPEDSMAQAAYYRADSLGCFGCHGTGGRLSRPNPGSFKGYVPSWTTEDFSELVESRAEFDQWVTSGVSDRFKGNPLASFFLNRALLKMPAYKDHLSLGDLDALWAYVKWVRGE